MTRHLYFTLYVIFLGSMYSSNGGIRDILHETKETIKDTAHDVVDIVTPDDRKNRRHRRYHKNHRHHNHRSHRD